MSESNARWVLCADSNSKMMGKILRTELRPSMETEVEGIQSGASHRKGPDQQSKGKDVDKIRFR